MRSPQHPAIDLHPARSPLLTSTLTLASLSLLMACASDASSGASSGFADFNPAADTSSFSDAGSWYAGDTVATYDTASDAFGPDLPPPPPPEDERDFDLRTPEAGQSFLYIPSAALDALVVVDAATMAVHLVEVGVAPTLVRALPGDAGAIVLNSGSDTISVVRPTGPGRFDITALDVVPASNRLAVSPDGEWAFIWYDPRTPSARGVGSLQDVSVARLVPGEDVVYNVVVGPRPEKIIFTDGGQLALLFCDNGISGVRLADLAGDTFLPPVRVNADPFHQAVDREIAVTPDGRYAVVRDLSAPELTLVDLETTALTSLSLDDWPSDLDLTPDGVTALVPMKSSEQLALIRVPDAFLWTADDNATEADNPYIISAYTAAPFGAAELTSDGTRALLYTTEPGTAAIGMVDIASAEVFLQPLAKEVTDVLVSPDGRMAALLLRRGYGAGDDTANKDAYALLDLDTGFSKLMVVESPVSEVIFTDDSAELFVLMPDPLGTRHLVHRVSTRSFAVIPYDTPDAPIFVGAMPAVHRVAIALDNPTGWITFVDTDDGAVDQVNSFELNSFIR